MDNRVLRLWSYSTHNPSERTLSLLLDYFGLQQHVQVCTQTRGHTLHLAITNSALISSPVGDNLGVFYQRVVTMALTFLLHSTRPKRQMTFWNWKRTNPTVMNTDLQCIACPSSATIDELVDHCNSSLSSILDHYDRMKAHEVSFEHSGLLGTLVDRDLECQARHSGLI